MEPTRQLARFVNETGFEDLPADLVERAKVYLLDNLAAGFVGAVQPWSLMVASLAQDLGGKPEVSVFNQPWRADLSRATLVNGAMMGAFEAEHIGHVAHPSATVFPAALALAERDHLPGRAFIAALLLGYEVVCRIGEAQTRAVEAERGFHNPGVNGAFGAAAAVGKLLGLDEQGLAWSLGIAGSHACGLVEFVWEGAMTKRIHPGRAAQLGLESALLAQKGFSGPTTVLEGRYGYLQAYSPRPQAERLLAGLGEQWFCSDLVIKAYPCHATGQAVAHAIQRSKRERPLDPRAIKQVRLTVPHHAAEARHLDREPHTLLGAQYSLPFTTAVALSRDLSDPLVFDEATLQDPAVRELATRVEVRGEDQESGAGEIVIELERESLRLKADGFPGSAAAPLDFEGAADKLRRYSARLVPAERAERMVALVRDLERSADVGELARLLSTDGLSR